MLQRLLIILLVLFGIHLAGASEAAAAINRKPDVNVRPRSCLRVNKPLKQAVKIQHDFTVRARVPLICKTCSLRTPETAGTTPGGFPCSFNRSASGQQGAGSAYILGLIYPFHFFL